MKKSLVLIPFLLLAVSRVHAAFLVQPGDVVGVAGDSITEQHLYSAFIEDYLLMCQPSAHQRIVQFGWSGEQAPAFLARLKTDVFPFKPTVMTTCYGMNDGHYGPLTEDVATTYRAAQTGIVEALKKNGVRAIVLGSSKCVDSSYYHHDPAAAQIYNQTLASLAEIDKDIAAKEGVAYADVYGVTLDTMQKAKAKFGDDYEFAGHDGVHPGPNGHLVMAYAFLKALGCDGNIGAITVEPGLNRAEGTPGQQIVSCQGGVVTLKSTRYPFCFTGASDSKNPADTAAVATVFPFNDDLNRYVLIVKGLTTPKAKITWGGTTKEYAAADLEKGINLAAEFTANPFVGQFDKVNAAVHEQETQETTLSKIFMHNAEQWKQQLAPEAGKAFDQIIAAGRARHDELYKKASALVIPIEHTIQIEPSS